MAETAKVKKGGYVRMAASHSGTNPETGEDVAYSPDQVLLVGTDIPVGQAAAFVAEPEDDPRARVLDDDEGKRVRAEQRAQIEQNTAQANETPRRSTPKPPEPDPHVGEVAAEETAAARRDLEEALSAGELTLMGLFDAVDQEEGDEHRIAGHMHVRAVLLALPEIGEVKADEILSVVGVEGDRHIDTLGSQQREELIKTAEAEQSGGREPSGEPAPNEPGDPSAEPSGASEPGDPNGEPGSGAPGEEADEVDPEKRSSEPEDQTERATSPEAEKRETATQKRGGGRKVKPPEEKPDE